jgi:1-phosphofructokinase family hexose kinase
VAHVVLAAGLTPAWQQVLVFNTFTPGTVNRAREVHWCASGKVLNVARSLHSLGGSARALTIVGGAPGQQIQEDFAALGIAARWVEVATTTRVCTTILDRARHHATELVPNAGAIGAREQQAFLDAYSEEAAAARVVVLIGSLPAGTPPHYYRELLARTRGRAIVDARGPELLEALPARPFLVKPNREELGRTLGRELHSEAALADALAEVNRRGAEWVLVTDGHRPAYARSAEGLYRFEPPTVEAVNPIGCGDCAAAAIARALLQGREPPEAIRYGMAAAADKVGQVLPAAVSAARVEARVGSVEVTRL